MALYKFDYYYYYYYYYIEAGVDAVTTVCPSATIVLAGDFNTLDDTELATRGAIDTHVAPTFSTESTSTIQATAPPSESSNPWSRVTTGPSSSTKLDDHASAQSNFDNMYGVMVDPMDRFNPERDPPADKALLRRKNRLMRAGRLTDEAGSIAASIRNTISRSRSRWLRQINTRKNAKDAWAKCAKSSKGRQTVPANYHTASITGQSTSSKTTPTAGAISPELSRQQSPSYTPASFKHRR